MFAVVNTIRRCYQFVTEIMDEPVARPRVGMGGSFPLTFHEDQFCNSSKSDGKLIEGWVKKQISQELTSTVFQSLLEEKESRPIYGIHEFHPANW